MAPLIPDKLLLNLRVIIPNCLAADRKRDRNRESERRHRTAAGIVSRDKYLTSAEEQRRQVHSFDDLVATLVLHDVLADAVDMDNSQFGRVVASIELSSW